MRLRKLTIGLVGSVVALTGVAASQATINSVGDPGQSWSIPNDASLGEHIQMFLDSQPGEQPSYLFNPNTPTANTQGRDYLQDPTCTSADDPRCVSQQLQYQAVLPYCDSTETINCVVDFGTVDSSGTKKSAAFSRYFPLKAINQYKGDPNLHLPSGVAGSLFAVANAPHDGGNLYYVAAEMKGSGSSTGFFRADNFQIRVYPVQLQPVNLGSASDNQIDAGFALSNRGRSDGTKYWGQGGPGYSGNQFCVAESGVEQKCAARFAFPANIRFYVKVRVQQLPGGWMHGRIANPTISITSSSVTGGATYTDIDIEANPVAVPSVYKMYNWNDMPTALRANYDTATGSYNKDPWFISDPKNANPGGRSAPNVDPLKRNVIIAPDAWSATGMDQLKLWLPYVNDQATALLSYWSVRSLSQGEMQGSNSCFNDSNSVTGVVTTNSTQYSAGPPSFDKSQGILNYSVAAPHFTTARDVFQGSYDLLMRSDVARCVYGFSKAPIKASISVTSADGSPQTATTILSEQNGWVHLAASGFQFSSPSIQVKMSQDANASGTTLAPTAATTGSPAPVVPQPAPSASASETPAPSPSDSSTPQPSSTQATLSVVPQKKMTITCIKGKTTKSVTATKPTCPSGYKKK